MKEKLELLLTESKNIESQLVDPNIISDQKKYIALSKRVAEIRPIVETYLELKKYITQKNEAESLLKDPDMKELAKDEFESAQANIIIIEDKLKVLLIPKDPNDDKDIIIEIRPAAGWDEASLFAWELFRMYLRFAENQWFKVNILSSQYTEWEWIKYCAFEVIWDWAYSKFKYESWVHRVQRIPITEAQGRVHTSTATVAVMPKADEITEIQIKPDELRIDTFRAQWAWGQHVNKTESAVRITHLPTWLVVECQDWRSQHQNKASAMAVLKSRLYSDKLEKNQKERSDMRLAQVWTWDRSEKIRTYNFPQDRLTDHRIKENWSNLPNIMDWYLEKIVEKMQLEDNARRLLAWE